MTEMINYSPASIALVGTGMITALLKMLASKGLLTAAEVRQTIETARADLADQASTPAVGDALRLIEQMIASEILAPRPAGS